MPASCITRTIFSNASRFCSRVAVQLDIGDMAGVGQLVIRRLQPDLLNCAEIGIVHRHVEAVGVVFAVGNARDHAVLLAVDAHKASGQALGGRGEQREVEAGASALPRRMRSRMWPMISRPRFCARLALAVVLADQAP